MFASNTLRAFSTSVIIFSCLFLATRTCPCFYCCVHIFLNDLFQPRFSVVKLTQIHNPFNSQLTGSRFSVLNLYFSIILLSRDGHHYHWNSCSICHWLSIRFCTGVGSSAPAPARLFMAALAGEHAYEALSKLEAGTGGHGSSGTWHALLVKSRHTIHSERGRKSSDNSCIS